MITEDNRWKDDIQKVARWAEQLTELNGDSLERRMFKAGPKDALNDDDDDSAMLMYQL